MAKSNNKKPAEVVEIVVSKSTGKNGATMSYIKVQDVPVVDLSKIIEAGKIMQDICINILAGNVDPALAEAASTRGGLAKMFGGKLSDADTAAIKVLGKIGFLSNNPDAAENLRGSWAAYVDGLKRLRCVSLQGLVKAIAEPGEKKISLKEALQVWVVNYPKLYATLDRTLVDIFVDFKIDESEANK